MTVETVPLFRFDHVLTQAEFELFARISGDDNPIHVDPAFSARTRFGRTVAHGMFLYTLLWSQLRRSVPGTSVREQTLMFPNPSFAGDRLIGEAMIERHQDGLARIIAHLTRAGDGATVCAATTLLDTVGEAA